MPTHRDDAPLSPPAEHTANAAGRTTCPPEESRMNPSHDVNDGQPSLILHNGEQPFNAPAQQPTPPPTERESPAHAHSPSNPNPKPTESPIEGPVRDIPTPMSATDDSVEDPRNPQASPLSATASAPVSWPQPRHLTSAYPSHRVCITTPLRSQQHARNMVANRVHSSSPTPRPRYSDPEADSRVARPPTANNTKSK